MCDTLLCNLIGPTTSVSTVAQLSNGNIAVGYNSGIVNIYKEGTWNLISSHCNQKLPIVRILPITDDCIVIMTAYYKVYVYYIYSRKLFTLFDSYNSTLDMCIVSNTYIAIACLSSGMITIVDSLTAACIARYNQDEPIISLTQLTPLDILCLTDRY